MYFISDKVIDQHFSKLETGVYTVKEICSGNFYILKQPKIYDDKQRQRFEENITSWKKCNHESNFIVSFIEHFYENDNLFIIMEYCSGGDLKKMIEKMISDGKNFSEEVFVHSNILFF
jgi:serine/threonine protein kinase